MDMFAADDEATVVSSRVLCTPSSFARSSLLHLQEVGELRALRPHVSSRAGLPSYLFFLVLDGAGMLTYGTRDYPLQAGSCVFVDCRRPYAHQTSATHLWSLRWCHFSGPGMDAVHAKYVERGGAPTFVPASVDPFCDVWEQLLTLASGEDKPQYFSRKFKEVEGMPPGAFRDSW